MIKKLQTGNIILPWSQEELQDKANYIRQDMLHRAQTGKSLDEEDKDQRNRRMASGLAAIGGIIQYELPYIGGALQVPDLLYDSYDLINSKNAKEGLKNVAHLALDIPIVGAVQNANFPSNWTAFRNLQRLLKKTKGDESYTAAGVIDDSEAAKGEDAISNIYIDI